jgi:hypothetical protein
MSAARYTIILFLLAISWSSPESYAADITWKVFLKNASSPLHTAVTRSGEEFVVPRLTISGGEEIADALENARFLIPNASNPLEIRIVLNISGSSFDTAHQKTMFLNMTVGAFVNGVPETSYRFPQGSPMVFSLTLDGLTSLLDLCGFTRNDDILLAFETGSAFTKDGIVTRHLTSGFQAEISHLSTIVGSKADLLGLSPDARPGTWGQIKLLFK